MASNPRIPFAFLPRGIRNHNPGNIRRGAQRWRGAAPEQVDADFVTFDTALHGLRALMRLLVVYRAKHGLDTVQALINRYAPPAENATDAYARHVAAALKVRRTQKIDVFNPSVLAALAAAIVRHENGSPPAGHPPDWYPTELYAQGAALALQPTLE